MLESGLRQIAVALMLVEVLLSKRLAMPGRSRLAPRPVPALHW
jgi:hypothetical protein